MGAFFSCLESRGTKLLDSFFNYKMLKLIKLGKECAGAGEHSEQEIFSQKLHTDADEILNTYLDENGIVKSNEAVVF